MTQTRLVTIVDREDAVLAYKKESEVDYSTEIYRVSALWVKNVRGEVLLAQRSLQHGHMPGLWGPAVAGTVEDETYEENIRSEMAEELGLEGVEFEIGPKVYREVNNRRYFCQWYEATLEPEIVTKLAFEEDEVEGVAWINEAELAKDVHVHPEKYLPGFDETVALFCKSGNAKTIMSYEINADDYITSRNPKESEQYAKWIADDLEKFSKTVKIFEVGTGTGYDADYLESLGYSVVRSDVAQSFIDFNKQRGKEAMKFDVVNDKFTEAYDVIFAVNVMQHLGREEFKKALSNVVGALSDKGHFLFSITVGDGSEEWHNDEGGPRYFLNWKIEDLEKVLQDVGLMMIYKKEIGYKNWVDIIVEKI